MSYYQTETLRIRKICYSNQEQIDIVIETRKYIDKNFDEKISLDLLSHVQSVSKYHLLRLYKRYYGQTPKQYLIEKRIEKAKAFLIEGRSISDTCFSVGFESPSSFSLLFKKKIGLSPSEFQKSNFRYETN